MAFLVYKITGVLLCVTVMLMEPSCLRDSYEIKIAGPTEIGDQWIELKPPSPLKADKDGAMILLEMEPPYRDDFYKEGKGPNKGKGVLMPDGDVINPEIQVTDQTGAKYDLVYAGARRTFWPAYNLPSPNKWPKDRNYTLIRIRSPRPIKSKAIYWFSESNKDMK